MDEYNNILTKLKSIALIKEEDTYSTVSEEPIPHNSWSSFLYRRYNRENPVKTIQYIKEVLYSALNLINKYKDNENEIRLLLINALNGLSNLKITYKNYSNTITDIDNILTDINTNMLNNCVVTDDVSGELYIPDNILNDINTPTLDNYIVTDDGSGELYITDNTLNVTDNGSNELYINVTDQFFNNLYESNYDGISAYLHDGNDVNIMNDNGENAMHILCNKKYYNKEIFKLIMSFNVNFTKKDNKGFTPLDCAVNTNCSEAVVDIELQIMLENKKKTRVVH